jgi:hypothetical protein
MCAGARSMRVYAHSMCTGAAGVYLITNIYSLESLHIWMTYPQLK